MACKGLLGQFTVLACSGFRGFRVLGIWGLACYGVGFGVWFRVGFRVLGFRGIRV